MSQLTTNGLLTVSRGYMSGALDADAVAQLDAAIRHGLPDARWPEKEFYISTKKPTFEGYSIVGATAIEALGR